jgi:formamidopyrimidine-DNA glycosylase
MPELPEVEIYTRYFERHALRKKVARVHVRDERILGDIRKETFERRLRGRQFVSVRRHGKHLFAETQGTWLHLHFGMTGDLLHGESGEAEPRFPRVVFVFQGGSWLAFDDMRLFGLVELVNDPDVYITEHGLGHDPLDARFTAARFARALDGRRGAVKSLLMGQEVVAGLGNLYVDEVLFERSIDPRRSVEKISEEDKRALFTAIRRLMKAAVRQHERNAELPARSLIHHREAGALCPRCGGTIRRTVVYGRTTFYCPKHQR